MPPPSLVLTGADPSPPGQPQEQTPVDNPQAEVGIKPQLNSTGNVAKRIENLSYPGDITVGLLWGALVGYGVYRLYCRITIPARYDMRHLWVPIGILCLTILFAFVKAAL